MWCVEFHGWSNRREIKSVYIIRKTSLFDSNSLITQMNSLTILLLSTDDTKLRKVNSLQCLFVAFKCIPNSTRNCLVAPVSAVNDLLRWHITEIYCVSEFPLLYNRSQFLPILGPPILWKTAIYALINHLKSNGYSYLPPGLTFKNSTSYPHSVFMSFVWISEQTAITSL